MMGEPCLESSWKLLHACNLCTFVILSNILFDLVCHVCKHGQRMSAELIFFNTLLPVVGQMANTPNKELAAVAADFHADLAKKVARLKRAEADREQSPSEALKPADAA